MPLVRPACGQDVPSWAAALTSIGIALSSHTKARRVDRLVASYAATVNHLTDLRDRFELDRKGKDDNEWLRQRYVRDCESAISNES